jgi:hypothetical protein
MLEKDDVRFNYSQLVPYISSETLKNQALYEAVSAVFADLFDWIKEHVSVIIFRRKRQLMNLHAYCSSKRTFPQNMKSLLR